MLLFAGTASQADALNRPILPSGHRVFRHTERNMLANPRLGMTQDMPGLFAGDRKEIKQNSIEPDVVLGPVTQCGTLDGPGKVMWYYTGTLDVKVIPHEYYNELVPLYFTYTIYDSEMKEVGKISDMIRYTEDEVRCVGCDLIPVITSRFFNNDDKYEVMIGLSINSTTPGINHYRTYAYSIGGEKETVKVEDAQSGDIVSKVVDKPVYALENSVGDVLDASHDGVEEFYISVYKESLPDFEFDGDFSEMTKDEFWNQLLKANISVTTYSKVQANGKLGLVHNYVLPTLCVPGDQEYTPYVLTYVHDNAPYIACMRYVEPFWNPYGPSEEQTMRESNKLQIKIYKLSETGSTEVQTTDIAFTKDTSNPDVLATFTGVGDLRYNDDINYGNFTTDGLASFYVSQYNYLVGDHSSATSYYVYSPEGKKIKNVFRDADSSIALSNIPGAQPQQMFVSIVGSEYAYNFVDLLSCTTVATIPYLLYADEDSDADVLIADNMDRVQTGDTYKYVFEISAPLVDDNENTLMRIAWFNSDGTFSNIDEVNMGQNVLYAKAYIENQNLRPNLFTKDGKRAYTLLVKRGVSGSLLIEELLVAQPLSEDNPEGRTLFEAGPDEHGDLRLIYLNPSESAPMLTISRYHSESDTFYWSFYYLPFDSSDITEIEAGSAFGKISFDGSSVCCEGAVINIYDLTGTIAATGFGSVNVASLSSGIYVAAADGKACKFVIK